MTNFIDNNSNDDRELTNLFMSIEELETGDDVINILMDLDDLWNNLTDPTKASLISHIVNHCDPVQLIDVLDHIFNGLAKTA